MWKLLAILAAAALAGGAYFVYSGGPQENDWAGKTVVAFGDSLVAGEGAPPGKDFPSLLSSRLGITIINAGRSGDTTAKALERLREDVLSRKPDIVLVLIGGNDALQAVPKEAVIRNIETAIDQIQAANGKIMLIGLRSVLMGARYEGLFEEIASRREVSFVPDILGGIFTDQALMADAIHPNAAGYEKIAAKIEPALRGLLGR